MAASTSHPPTPRLDRERRTIQAMVRIFCRGRHGGAEVPCLSCRELIDYAMCRLDRCPYGESKPTCQDCPIHCYKPAMRERVREVMRYAGPRMLLRHPVLTLRHWIGGWNRPPLDAL